MPRGKRTEDLSILRMALIGYRAEKQKIENKIAEIQARLQGIHVSTAAPAVVAGKRKRVMSASARARIAAAQRKRWAEHRKKLAAAK